MKRRYRPAVALLAAIAVLLHAFWPFIEQARAARPALVQVICTAHGVMLVPVDDAPESPPGGAPKACDAMCANAGIALVGDSCSSPARSDPAAGFDVAAHVPADRPALRPTAFPRAPPRLRLAL